MSSSVKEESKAFIAFSGGVESTSMCLLFGHRAQAIFSDTGAEHPEMYERLEYVEKQMRLVHPDFNIIRIKAHKPDGKDVDNLTDYIIDAGVFPNQVMRFCTKYFKIRPFEKFLKDKRPCSLMIGLNHEERDREGNHGLEGVSIEYPLQDLNMTRQMCIDLLKEYDLEPRLPVYMKRGGCIYCPYKSRKEYIAMCHLAPDTMNKLIDIETTVNKRERNGKKRKKFWAAANAVPEGFKKLMENEMDQAMFAPDEMYGHEPEVINTSCGVFCNR